jgi:RHS repeat-associated protein
VTNNSALRASFVYDGLGRCVKRTLNGVTRVFNYDGWQPIYEWGAAGEFVAWNAYGAGADEILFRSQAGVGHLRYHTDRQGNVTALLDDSGNVVEKYRYDAFGQPTITYSDGSVSSHWSHGSAVGNRFMFQGREYLNEIGLFDYRHRLYNPETGRFLQIDPLGLQTEGEKLSVGQKALFSPGGSAPEAFGSSEMNLFRYCGDDPVDGSDPMGLVPPGEGLIDLPRRSVQEMKEAMQENIKRTLTEQSPDAPGGKPRHQEHRTMAYDNDKGERKTSTETGYHKNNVPMTDKPKNPFGKQPATPAWDTHSHISGSGKPYPPADTSGYTLRIPSGVQSATGGPLYIWVASATLGGQGGLFRVQGAGLINERTGEPAPH